MKFYNLDKIMDNVNVHNKYLLTSVVAQRARQISDMLNEDAPEETPEEKAIALALGDIEAGNVSVTLGKESVSGGIEDELDEDRTAKTDSGDAEGEETADAE